MKIIIIAGCQRSGTTLMGQMFGAHSQGFLIDETDELYHWTNAWLTNAKNKNILLNQAIKNASQKYLDERFDINQTKDLANRFLVLKAPNLTFYSKQISKLRDDISIIYPIRDVRAVVASMLQLKKSKMIINQTNYFLKSDFIRNTYSNDLKILKDDNTELHIKSAIIWKIKSLLIKQFELENLNPLLIKYENLISEPTQLVTQVAKHCHIKYETNMNMHHLYMDGKGPGNTKRNRKIDDVSLKKWDTQLNSEQLDEIMEIAQQTMSDFDYDI
ncbi:MAG: sulfotransferase [Proteobacteria bacterium]|nr:sulfotransferase [Pseudomonadota bacterium]